MQYLVKDVRGFPAMDHMQTPGVLGITVRCSRDAEALAGCGATPSTARHKDVAKRSGTGATRCTWRKWSGAKGSGECRSRRGDDRLTE